MKNLEKLLADLRFVIGLFFGIISLILLAAACFLVPAKPEFGNLNLISGSMMFVFSAFMLISALRSSRDA